MKKMRIVLAIPYNPLEEIGGLEISTVRLATSLKKFRQEVKILTKGRNGSVNGVPVEGKKNISEICEWLLKHRNDFDVLNWMEIFPNPGEINVQCLTSGLLRSYKKKVFLTVATSGNLENRAKGDFVKSLIQNTMDDYIVLNLGQVKEFQEYGIKENIHPIGFGIDTKRTFCPVTLSEGIELRKKLNLPLGKTLLLSIGRLVDRKQPDFLLNTWKNLRDIYDEALFVMIGSGFGQHDSIEEKVVKLAKTCKNLIFREMSFELDPREYYQSCDALIFNSEREGQPNVIMEAMACGIPIIGSNIPGVIELVKDGENGLIFPVGNSEKLSTAIRKLTHNHRLMIKLGERARNSIIKEKDIRDITKQYIELYKRGSSTSFFI